MQSFSTCQDILFTRGASVVETIGDLHHAFATMKQALSEARHEISRLHRQLVHQRAQVSQEELATLRRRVAFRCHPDRGGDADLMSRLNLLFDSLECIHGPLDEEDEGEVVPC